MSAHSPTLAAKESIPDARGGTSLISIPKILIVGATPPPSIGPTIAMQKLLTHPELHNAFEVLHLDISDRRGHGGLSQWDLTNIYLALKHAAKSFIILFTHRPAILYIGISQGLGGYLRDLAIILPAMILRRHVVIHLRGSEFRTFHDSLIAPLRLLSALMLSHCSNVIVLGNCLRPIFHGLVPAERVSVVPNGIDYTAFAHNQPRFVSGKRLLMVSSLRRRKGVFLVLDAFSQVLRTHPDATLTIVGEWRTEMERQEAAATITKLGLCTSVHFTGELVGDDKIKAYQNHDVFVFTPVEPEGLPWVILEAMSSGLPVITTSQGAIAEVVVNDTTGVICIPTAAEVGKAITRLLNDPLTALDMGKAGYQRVVHHFSEAAYISALVSVFSEISKQSLNRP